MGLKQWLFEGTQGATLTPANSGALAVAVAGGGSAVFDTAMAAHGTTGAKFVSGTDTSSSIAQLGPDVSSLTFSFSVVVTLPSSVPSVSVPLVKFHGSNYATQLVYATNGAVQMVGHNLQLAAWTTGVTPGGRYRFTFWGTVSTTAGESTLHARMYDSDGAQINSLDTTTADLGTSAFTEIWVGAGANGTAGITVGIDDAQWNSGTATELPAINANPPAAAATLTDNQAKIAAAGSGGTGPYSYSISPTTGTTPAGTGVWLVTKDAVNTVDYTITVTDSVGLTATDTVSVPPVAAGSSPWPKRPTGTVPGNSWG